MINQEWTIKRNGQHTRPQQTKQSDRRGRDRMVHS